MTTEFNANKLPEIVISRKPDGETVLRQLRERFPQIDINTPADEIVAPSSAISYSCKFHGGRATEKLSKLATKKYSCKLCGNLLNRGHGVNLRGKPYEDRKIQQISKFFAHKFDYSQFRAQDVFTPSTIRCPEHGALHLSLTDHIMSNGETGCPYCNTPGLFEEERAKKDARKHTPPPYMSRAKKDQMMAIKEQIATGAVSKSEDFFSPSSVMKAPDSSGRDWMEAAKVKFKELS